MVLVQELEWKSHALDMKICHLSVNRKAIKNSHKAGCGNSNRNFFNKRVAWILYGFVYSKKTKRAKRAKILSNFNIFFVQRKNQKSTFIWYIFQPLFFGRSVLQSQRNIFEIEYACLRCLLWSLLNEPTSVLVPYLKIQNSR